MQDSVNVLWQGTIKINNNLECICASMLFIIYQEVFFKISFVFCQC